MIEDDYQMFFDSLSSSKKKGGSLASDNVMIATQGGRIKYRLHHGAGSGLPTASLDSPPVMSSSVATNYVQPLTPSIPSNNTVLFPAYYGTFSPALTQVG